MRFFIAYLFLLFTLSSAQGAQEEISLHLHSESSGVLRYTLEAKNITHPLIGIGTTMVLPSGMQFVRFEKGVFFEQGKNDQVTYLIAPKNNNPQQIILGIASLGEKMSKGNGVIATLYFKTTKKSSPSAIKLEHTVASGIENGRRVDYPNIVWQISATQLPSSGTSLFLPFIMLTAALVSYVLQYRGSIFSKVLNLWYNGMNTKTNHYELLSQKNTCKKTSLSDTKKIHATILGQLFNESNNKKDSK